MLNLLCKGRVYYLPHQAYHASRDGYSCRDLRWAADLPPADSYHVHNIPTRWSILLGSYYRCSTHSRNLTAIMHTARRSVPRRHFILNNNDFDRCLSKDFL